MMRWVPAKPYAMQPNSIFQTLPNELLTSTILWIDSPRDLLHLALTNKFFFEIIVPNILYFTNISCDLPSRIPILWKTLNAQPHLAKQIRILDIVPEDDYTRLKESGYKFGFRLNSQTWPSIWPSNPLLKFDIDATKLSNIIPYMERLAALSMKLSLTVPDLRDLLKNLIIFCPHLKMLSLQLHVSQEMAGFSPMQFDPCGLPASRLTSFSFVSTNNKNINREGVLMDFLASQHPMMADLSLINKTAVCLSLPTFFQDASWPNLRRLTLMGCFTLYPPTSQNNQQRRIDLSLAFFKRHHLLESFYLSESLGSRALERATFLHPSAFPSLRSIRYSFFPLNREIVERLVHIEDLEVHSLAMIRQARSLRSCSFISTGANDIETLTDQVPDLQRLSLTWFVVLDEECGLHGSLFPILPCTCLRDRLWSALIRLKNLTHLVLDLILDATPEYLYPLYNIAENLPKLRYLRVRLNGVGKWIIIERGPLSSVARRFIEGEAMFEEFHNGQWGNFFRNWVI